MAFDRINTELNPELKEAQKERDQYKDPVDFSKNLRSASVPTKIK